MGKRNNVHLLTGVTFITFLWVFAATLYEAKQER